MEEEKDPSAAPAETPAAETQPATEETPAGQPATQAAPAEPAITADDLAQAEMRGYLRGRNERIEELMRQPSPLQRPDAAPQDTSEAAPEPLILKNQRISIWDL